MSKYYVMDDGFKWYSHVPQRVDENSLNGLNLQGKKKRNRS